MIGQTSGNKPASGVPASGIAARNYSWPPFQPGNAAARVHGAYTSRWLDERAVQIRDAILNAEGNEYLSEPKYALALADLVRLERRVELLTEAVEKLGIEEASVDTEQSDSTETHASGRSRRMTTTRRRQAALAGLERAEREARRCRNDLGLTPMSRARLGRDVAAARVDVASLLSRLSAERDQSEATR